jgi:signal recognition particle GTPase
MFDTLSGKLQNVFRNLRGLGRISETNVADALREVRLALLDTDVNFKVAREQRDHPLCEGVNYTQFREKCLASRLKTGRSRDSNFA